MKRLKGLKIFLVLTIICTLFSFNMTVYAASASVELRGNSTAYVGENISITMYVSNVSGTNGGIVSVGGSLKYDPSYLQYVSSTGVSSPYQFQSNKISDGNYKIAGLDTSLSSGITKETKVFTFVFKPLKEGSTTITLEGASLTDTSQKVSTSVSPKTINITTAPAKSSDATLKSLSVSGYSISPSFSSSTTSYKVTVPSTETSVTINATANHSAARVSGAGKINLSGDNTTATVKVTAENGSTKSYNVTINREKAVTPTPVPSSKSGDATLKSLSVSGKALSPSFKSSVTVYSMKVDNDVTGLDVKAVANDSKASVTVTGNKGWSVGNNTITIKVVAENGSVNYYLVNVLRAAAQTDNQNSVTPSTPTVSKKSSDNYLKELNIISAHEIMPNFDKNITSYNVVVPYEVDDLDFETVKNNKKATVSISGDGSLSTTDVNVIQIVVTAEDNSIRIYTLNVTRSAYKSGAYLKDLYINGAQLSPNFNSDVLEYKTDINDDTEKLDISAIPGDSSSVVEIIGNDNLREGSNSIFIKVTDTNGFTQVYSINVAKAAAAATILGFTYTQFFVILFIILLLLILLGFILYLLFKKDKKETDESKNNEPVTPAPAMPNVFEFKPEFNFNSKNSSDNDTILGNPSQNNYDAILEHKNKDLLTYDKNNTNISEAKYEEKYDPFDQIVTKDELYDAFKEAQETKNSDKLNMLLEQEKLNRRKEEIKIQEDIKKSQEERFKEWR